MGSLIVDRRVRRVDAALQHTRESDGLPAEIAILRGDRVMLACNRAVAANIVELVFLMTVKPAGEALALSLLIALAVAGLLGTTAAKLSRAAVVQH